MNLLVPDIGLAEKVVRSVVVYGFLLVAFRLCGERQLGQLTAGHPPRLLEEDGHVSVIARRPPGE